MKKFAANSGILRLSFTKFDKYEIKLVKSFACETYHDQRTYYLPVPYPYSVFKNPPLQPPLVHLHINICLPSYFTSITQDPMIYAHGSPPFFKTLNKSKPNTSDQKSCQRAGPRITQPITPPPPWPRIRFSRNLRFPTFRPKRPSAKPRSLLLT